MVEVYLEKWQGSVLTVQIGQTKHEGGSRSQAIKVGGERALPFLFKEGDLLNKPEVAYEIWDTPPRDWPLPLEKELSSYWKNPVDWAKIYQEKFKAKLLCLRLQSIHPDYENNSASQAAKLVSELLKKVDLPLIIIGCGDDAKDNQVLPLVSEVARGERCLLGSAVSDNYRTIVASAIADGHCVIAESPIDVNIAKQLNMLITDLGLPLERIVINPTIGALGYGLEYAYSIMERARLACLAGDKIISCPFICFVGQEAWKVKEAKATEEEFPEWKDQFKRGLYWEVTTAIALLQAGADILVMRHPESIRAVCAYINNLYPAEE